MVFSTGTVGRLPDRERSFRAVRVFFFSTPNEEAFHSEAGPFRKTKAGVIFSPVILRCVQRLDCAMPCNSQQNKFSLRIKTLLSGTSKEYTASNIHCFLITPELGYTLKKSIRCAVPNSCLCLFHSVSLRQESVKTAAVRPIGVTVTLPLLKTLERNAAATTRSLKEAFLLSSPLRCFASLPVAVLH